MQRQWSNAEEKMLGNKEEGNKERMEEENIIEDEDEKNEG